MAVTYAEFHVRRAYLSTPFGKELAMRRLHCTEQQLEAKVGRFQRGKRRGLLKGAIEWVKCERGGWVRTGHYDHDRGQGTGFVLRPGTYNWALVDSWTSDLIEYIDAEHCVRGLMR